MAKIVGYVKEIEGQFVAKSIDGHIRVLKTGDPIYATDVVYDPTHRSDHRIVIELADNGQTLALDGREVVHLDAAAATPLPGGAEENHGRQGAQESAEKGHKKEGGEHTQEHGEVSTSQTAEGKQTGSEAAAHGQSHGELNVAQTAAGNEAGRVGTAPHDYSLGQNDTFLTMEGQIVTNVITPPQTTPIYIPPMSFPNHPPIPPIIPIQPPLDTTPPEVAMTGISEDSGTAGDYLTDDNTLIFKGTAEPGSTVIVNVDGTVAGRVQTAPNGEWTLDYTDHTLSDGTHTVAVQAVDAAGNASGIVTQEVTIVHAPEASFEQLTQSALKLIGDLDGGIVFNFKEGDQDVGEGIVHYLDNHRVLEVDAYLADPYAADLQKVCSLIKDVYGGEGVVTVNDKIARASGEIEGQMLLDDHGNYVDISVVQLQMSTQADKAAGEIDLNIDMKAFNETVDNNGEIVDKSANFTQSDTIAIPVTEFNDADGTVTFDNGEVKGELAALLNEKFGEELVDQLREIIQQTDARCHISSNPEGAPELTGQTYFDVAFQVSTEGDPTFTMKIVEDYHHQV